MNITQITEGEQHILTDTLPSLTNTATANRVIAEINTMNHERNVEIYDGWNETKALAAEGDEDAIKKINSGYTSWKHGFIKDTKKKWETNSKKRLDLVLNWNKPTGYPAEVISAIESGGNKATTLSDGSVWKYDGKDYYRIK